ncbi:MAG TPA: hypothetical protein VEB18_03225 [Candidatus Paceibacterota bacterium]|nr:hypothetical protein [Candidatus Paceibacterota bacterium]
MTKRRAALYGVLLVILSVGAVGLGTRLGYWSYLAPHVPASVAMHDDYLHYTFAIPGTLYEAGSPEESTSPYWWLNSGGHMILRDGVGMTIQGPLPEQHRWHKKYATADPLDTDNGFYPQNLFRLISRHTWNDVSVEASFRIQNDNLSESPNRNESNGLLLMARYLDDDNLYYAGLRVDGAAVIKKKRYGTYYQLGYTQIYEGSYNRSGTSNLLPHQEWLRLRLEVTDVPEGVLLRLSLFEEGSWREILSAIDKGVHDVPTISEPGFIGIRTDFMDVEFDSVVVSER